MAKKGKYLIPTDFSKPARFALEEGLRMAKRDGVDVVLLHVIEQSEYPTGNVLTHGNFPNIADQMRAGGERQLSELQDELSSDHVPIQTMIRTGTPSVAIADASVEIGADMIIISSRGLSGLKRFFLGSTTERLVRIATCQVLVLRKEDS